MTIDQYQKWADEIRSQKDVIIKTQQFQRLCIVFIQDVWLDAGQPLSVTFLKNKAEVMFDLQGELCQ